MSQVTTPAPASALGALARMEISHYLRHPLFVVGLGLTVVGCAMGADTTSSSLYHVIIPGAALGVFGLIIMAGLVRRSDEAHEAAGAVVVTERTRTLALASAVVVPFSAGLAFFVWAVWAWHDSPPAPSAIPFGGYAGDGWAYAIMFALGTLSTAGGPILGLVIGRWAHFRGAAPLAAVVLVMVTVVMQGIIEPLRYIRVFVPWTYFGGPLGVEGDPGRWLMLTGSPQVYSLYLVALCVLGVLLALLHDREQPRRRLGKLAVCVGVIALALGTAAMVTGPQDVRINPLSSASAD